MNWKTSLLLSLVIVAAAAAATWLIFASEPSAQRSGASKQSAMLVEVVPAEGGDFAPRIVALGTVRPARHLELAARVGGEVVDRAPAFTPGGLVAAGETLLGIDPADYRNALALRRSELAQARSELAIEEGRHYVAEQDYRAFAEDLPPERRTLALREPQLAAAKARVEAAEAAVAQAELDLARTGLTAPFRALVLSRTVEVGSQVAPGQALGELVGTDEYWVEVSVPLAKLDRIAFPEGAEPGTRVELRNRSAWPDGVTREGRIHRLIGSLNATTRLARILVTVADPLGLDAEAGDRRALIIDSVLEARIEGAPLRDVVRIDRDLLRSGDTVWVMRDGALHIAEVSVAFRDERHAYIDGGLAPGAQVVVTDLATVVEGAALRLPGDDEGQGDGGAEVTEAAEDADADGGRDGR